MEILMIFRFGHSLCVGENIWVLGGFGEEDGKHKRLGTLIFTYY